MRITKIVFIAIVAMASSLLILVPVTEAADLAQASNATIHGKAQPDGACKYTFPGNTHGKSISEDPSSCTIIMEIKPGPGSDMPTPTEDNPIQWQGPNKPATPKTKTSGGSDPLSQAHMGVWLNNPYTGVTDDALVSYLQWTWDGSSADYYDGGPWAWPNTNYGWSIYYGPFYSIIDNSNDVLGHSNGGFYNSYVNWYDYYPSVDVVGYSDGTIQCDYTRPWQTVYSPLGYQCQYDWQTP